MYATFTKAMSKIPAVAGCTCILVPNISFGKRQEYSQLACKFYHYFVL